MSRRGSELTPPLSPTRSAGADEPQAMTPVRRKTVQAQFKLPSNSAKVVKEGTLGLFVQNSFLFMPHWQRYWFHLIDVCLYAYKTNDNRELIAVIPLEGSTIAELADSDETDSRQHVYKFSIRTPTKEEFLLSAYTKHAVSEWIEAINTQLAKRGDDVTARPAKLDEHGDKMITLHDILHNETSLMAFLTFLEGEFSSENLEFWMQVQRFKVTPADSKALIAQDIFHKFIFRNAPLQVNLPATTVKSISERLLAHQFDDNIFNTAEKDILALMEKDSLIRFMTTPQGQLVRLKFKSPDGMLLRNHLYKKADVGQGSWVRYLPKRAWQRRWCMLGVHSLVYLNAKADIDQATNVHGEIAFEDVVSIVDFGATVVQGAYPHQFLLEQKNGMKVCFAAPSAEVKLEWMEMLNAVFRVKQALQRANANQIPSEPMSTTNKAYRTARKSIVIADEKDQAEPEDDADYELDPSESSPNRDRAIELLELLFAAVSTIHAQERAQYITNGLKNRAIRIHTRSDPNQPRTLVSDVISFAVTSAESMLRLLDRVKRKAIEDEDFMLASHVKELVKITEVLAEEVIQERERARKRWMALKKYLPRDKWTQLTYAVTEDATSKTANLSASESLLRQFLGSVARRSPFKDDYTVQIEAHSGRLGQCTACHKNITHKGAPNVIMVPLASYKRVAQASRNNESADSDTIQEAVSWAHTKCVVCSNCKRVGVHGDQLKMYFVGSSRLCELCFTLAQARPKIEDADSKSEAETPSPRSPAAAAAKSLPPLDTQAKRASITKGLLSPMSASSADEPITPCAIPDDDVAFADMIDEVPESLDYLDEMLESEALPEELLAALPPGLSRPQLDGDAFDEVAEEDYEDEEEEEDTVECAYCNQLISAMTCISALDQTWCPEHFCCFECTLPIPLGEGYFVNDDKVYCQRDYKNLFLPRCNRCHDVIEDGQVYSALEHAWHPGCFTCAGCDVPIQAGQKFFAKDQQPYCSDCYSDRFLPKCQDCKLPILHTMKTVFDKHWHLHCFHCAVCGKGLEDRKVYTKDDQLYCEEDFRALFLRPCTACGKAIEGPSKMLDGQLFHADCFRCNVCTNLFEAGDKVLMHEKKLICMDDYLKTVCEKCQGCKKPIFREASLVALDGKWHPNCLVCSMCGCQFGDGAALYEYHGLPYCENDFRAMLEREDGIIVSNEMEPETNRSLLGMPPTPSSVAKKTPFFGDSPRNSTLPPPPVTSKPRLPPPPMTPPPSSFEEDDTTASDDSADRTVAPPPKRASAALRLNSLQSKPSTSRLPNGSKPPAEEATVDHATTTRRDSTPTSQPKIELPPPPPTSELPRPPPVHHHHPEHTPSATSQAKRPPQLAPPPRTATQRIGIRSPEEDTPELDMKVRSP